MQILTLMTQTELNNLMTHSQTLTTNKPYQELMKALGLNNEHPKDILEVATQLTDLRADLATQADNGETPDIDLEQHYPLITESMLNTELDKLRLDLIIILDPKTRSYKGNHTVTELRAKGL